MRDFSFSFRPLKLWLPCWVDFRLQRRDKDRQILEQVTVVINARSKYREELGIARLIQKDQRKLPGCEFMVAPLVTEGEAIEDGFDSLYQMTEWFYHQYGVRPQIEPLYKYTLEWVCT